LNITPVNQQSYGNLISKIEKSRDFSSYVGEQVTKNGANGSLNIPSDDPRYSFPFKSGDPLTALGKVNAGLSGKQSADGTWNLHVNINDTYNCEASSNYGNGNLSRTITSLNNAAVVGQTTGIITPYPVNISFDYIYKPQ
jgi:hypothetical protein